MSQWTAQELWQRLNTRLNGEELRTLCFSLSIDYDNLSGETKSLKAASLIDHVRRYSSLENLVDEINRTYPHVLL